MNEQLCATDLRQKITSNLPIASRVLVIGWFGDGGEISISRNLYIAQKHLKQYSY